MKRYRGARATIALAVLVLAGPAHAQVPPSPDAPPRVAAVSLDVPEADRLRLARYLEVRVGDPLDPTTVRHVVELLHATGEFQDVLVETRPHAEGVELVFRPVPAPLLREVRVEGDRVLRPGDARRLSRLRPREPLWPVRLDRAAQQVSLALVDRGYLEARVEARAVGTGDDTDVVFQIHAGPVVRVRGVIVEGAPPAVHGSLLALARPRRGEVFVREKAREAGERMKRFLAGHDRWGATVTVRESYDPAGARLGLAFEVGAGEPVRLVFVGQVAKRERRAVESLLREGELTRDALEEAQETLEQAYRRQGHREPLIRYAVSADGSQRTVTFTVEPGPRAIVASVTVAGDPPAGLERHLATTVQAPLQDQVVREDVQALQRALEELGHASAKVEAEVPEGGALIPVVFRVRAGPRTLVSTVDVASTIALPGTGPSRELLLRAGTPYRVRDLARDRDALLTSYRNAGHLQATVTPEVAFTEDLASAAVIFRVQPGPVTRIDHVVIAPLPYTREEVLRRELTLREGEPLSLEQVLESQQRLSALGLFERVTLTEMDPESSGARTVVVRAEDAPLTSVAYGIGYAQRELLRGSVEVTRRNLFGLDRRLSTFVRASFEGSRFVVTYREPHFFRKRQELFVTGYREEEDRDTFAFTRQGLSVQTTRPVSEHWSVILRATYQRTRTYRQTEDCLDVDRQFCPSTLSGPSASVVHDSRDDALDPRRGFFALMDGQFSHAVLGGDSLLKVFLQGATYQPLTARLVIALSAHLGLGRTLDRSATLLPLLPLLPRPDRFFLGGDYSLRGFELDQVRPEGGNALVLAGAELRRDLGRKFSAAAFAEAGNAYPLASDLSLRDLRYVAGLGLRYMSAVGPLRFDWGYKLDRRPGDEKRYNLHFTVGHAF
jgi:outer membrane protein insertion porin family